MPPTQPRLRRTAFQAGLAIWIALGVVLLATAVRNHLAARAPLAERSALAAGRASAPDGVSPRYESDYALDTGTEILLVFVGASFCGAHREPGFPQVVEDAKVRVQAEARVREHRFRTVAVSLDWDIGEALSFVESFGRFDEVSVGSNWVSDGAVRYVWQTFPGEPVVPQVIVLEREIEVAEGGIQFGEGRVLKRLSGVDEIQAWVEAGARL